MERFRKTYAQGALDVMEVWVDTETGVNYLFHRNGNASGLTPAAGQRGQARCDARRSLTRLPNDTRKRAACALHRRLFFGPEWRCQGKEKEKTKKR